MDKTINRSDFPAKQQFHLRHTTMNRTLQKHAASPPCGHQVSHRSWFVIPWNGRLTFVSNVFFGTGFSVVREILPEATSCRNHIPRKHVLGTTPEFTIPPWRFADIDV
jgi:hypothetical protein